MTLPIGWQADIIGGLGGEHTPSAENFLGAWQQWEGGGTHNKANFNPLNTTRGNYPKINSVGVSAFPDWQAGVAETVGTLGGYPAISEALKTGEVDFTNPALQADLNKWLTGKATPGMTPYVAKIARSYGQEVPAAATRGAERRTTPLPPPTPRPGVSFLDIALGRKSPLDMLRDSLRGGTPPAPAQSAALPNAAPRSGPGVLQIPPTWKGTHVTDGLKWGTKTAEDIMGSPGTPVSTPWAGTVMRMGSAQGGDSLWLKLDDGRTVWLGHIDATKSLRPGTRFDAGQVITAISADHPRPHVHVDIR